MPQCLQLCVAGISRPRQLDYDHVAVTIQCEQIEPAPSVPVPVLLSDNLQVVTQNVDLGKQQRVQILALPNPHRGELDRRSLSSVPPRNSYRVTTG